jgi:hypothetical protein
MYDSKTFIMTDYQTHIQSAIGVLSQEIKQLEKLGTEEGCLVKSPTSNGKSFQWHWANGKERTYVKQALKPTYVGEIARGKQVKELRSKIEALKNIF